MIGFTALPNRMRARLNRAATIRQSEARASESIIFSYLSKAVVTGRQPNFHYLQTTLEKLVDLWKTTQIIQHLIFMTLAKRSFESLQSGKIAKTKRFFTAQYQLVTALTKTVGRTNMTPSI